MATRFYFDRPGTPTISPAFDGAWEQTGQTFRRFLTPKTGTSLLAANTVGGPFTIPITTTQDILAFQFISGPIPPQNIIGTFSMVWFVSQSVTTANATLAVVVKVVSQDGSTIRGTLFSVFGTDTAFAVTASRATRIVNAQAVTPLTTQPGDCIAIEVGTRATAPSTSGSFSDNIGYDQASDYALTSGLTTTLNPWAEFSQTLFGTAINNYQFVRVGDGMSVSDKIR